MSTPDERRLPGASVVPVGGSFPDALPFPQVAPGRQRRFRVVGDRRTSQTVAAPPLTVNTRPKARRGTGQSHFWTPDRAVRGMPECRNLSGDFFEEATASLVNGVRLRTTGADDVCPDVIVDEGLYVESKGAGRNGAVIVYASRKAKDIDWTTQRGATLLYAVWNHTARVEGVAYTSDLYDRLTTALRDVVVIPAATLYAHCDGATCRIINTKGPYTPQGGGFGGEKYRDGWTIRTSRLRRECAWTGFARAQAFGRPLLVTVHTTPELSRLFV